MSRPELSVLHTLAPAILTTTLWGGYYQIHFTYEETKAWSDSATSSKDLDKDGMSWDLNPRTPYSKTCVLDLYTHHTLPGQFCNQGSQNNMTICSGGQDN